MSKVTDLVAAVTNIDGLDYRTINPEGGDWQAAAVAEGAQLPTATLRTSSGLVKLYKRGQVLSSSYEALRLQRLDLFTVALAQIGAGIAAAQMNDAVNALINGDGTKSGITFTAVSGSSLAYSDFLSLWGSLSPYQLNVIAAGTDGIQKLLQITEFKDAQAGLNFQGTGKLVRLWALPWSMYRAWRPARSSPWTRTAPWKWFRPGASVWTAESSSTGSLTRSLSAPPRALPGFSPARPKVSAIQWNKGKEGEEGDEPSPFFLMYGVYGGKEREPWNWIGRL